MEQSWLRMLFLRGTLESFKIPTQKMVNGFQKNGR